MCGRGGNRADDAHPHASPLSDMPENVETGLILNSYAEHSLARALLSTGQCVHPPGSLASP
jgi:hypothetical protein